MDTPGDATRLIQRMEAGDAEAAGELLPLLYDELRTLAEHYMQGERAGHTLEPTALVNEAYVRLVEGESQQAFESRGHFIHVAARAMRNVLVDHARAKKSDKRGGDRRRQPLDPLLAHYEQSQLDLLALDEALERLGQMDEQLARIVELRFFAGLTIAETAPLLGVSTPTVERGWRVARMWLRRELPSED
jgi:RNA polymerase sigma factor (TIGR02999 family)